jgi:hypothetical protein
MDWIHLAQDRNVCWASVITIMKLGVPQNSENLLTNL